MGRHSCLVDEGLKQCDSHRPFSLEVREGTRGHCCHCVEMVRPQQSSEWSLRQDGQVSGLGSAIDQGWTHSHFLWLLQHITRLSSLKQCRLVILWFWRSEVQKRSHWAKNKVSTGLQFFLEVLRENPFSRFFCFPGAAENPRLWPPSISKVSNSWWSLSHKHHADACLFLFYKDPVMTLGPPR